VGEFFALCSAVCFAVSNVTVTRGAAKGAADNGVFLSLLLTTVISGACWLTAAANRGFAPVTAQGLLWFAAAGLFTSFIGRVFLFSSIQKLGATRASAIKRLNPFFAVLLGVLVLSDPVNGGMALGMGLIMLSFAILVRNAFHASQKDQPRGHWLKQLSNLGYLYGPISALGYAIGYLLRKLGLGEVPNAYFGAMIGSMMGVAIFAFIALFRPSYRVAIISTFTNSNRWLFAAGLAFSFGQILYFVALSGSTVSRVAMIASIEVFVTLFLSVLVFKRQEALTRPVLTAAILGVAGTVCIAVL